MCIRLVADMVIGPVDMLVGLTVSSLAISGLSAIGQHEACKAHPHTVGGYDDVAVVALQLNQFRDLLSQPIAAR